MSLKALLLPRRQGDLMILRTENQASTVQLKDSICFKSVQIGSWEIGPWTLV
jgi:hypothetical protein